MTAAKKLTDYSDESYTTFDYLINTPRFHKALGEVVDLVEKFAIRERRSIMEALGCYSTFSGGGWSLVGLRKWYRQSGYLMEQAAKLYEKEFAGEHAEFGWLGGDTKEVICIGFEHRYHWGKEPVNVLKVFRPRKPFDPPKRVAPPHHKVVRTGVPFYQRTLDNFSDEVITHAHQTAHGWYASLDFGLNGNPNWRTERDVYFWNSPNFGAYGDTEDEAIRFCAHDCRQDARGLGGKYSPHALWSSYEMHWVLYKYWMNKASQLRKAGK